MGWRMAGASCRCNNMKIKRYITYFKYVLRHKFFVLRAYFWVNPTPHLLWRCLMHDMSKFRPSEYIPYAHTFVDDKGRPQYKETTEFNVAWNAHQKSNKHHWQYWMLKEDSGNLIPLNMPDIYIEEMICDWLGAGRAINGKYDFDFKWYENNKENMVVSKYTKMTIEMYIRKIKAHYGEQK